MKLNLTRCSLTSALHHVTWTDFILLLLLYYPSSIKLTPLTILQHIESAKGTISGAVQRRKGDQQDPVAVADPTFACQRRKSVTATWIVAAARTRRAVPAWLATWISSGARTASGAWTRHRSVTTKTIAATTRTNKDAVSWRRGNIRQ